MIIIIDTNIIISALIRDSTTRRIIIKSEWCFYYPEISFNEVKEYKALILEKSGMNEIEYIEILSQLMKRINLIPIERFIKKIDEAKKLIGNIDPNDVAFLAVALNFDGSVIWSEDKDFEKQNKVVIFKTKDIVEILGEEV